MEQPVIVSCLFSNGDFDIYPAPFREDCFFFTNRQEISDRARERGWNPVMMPWPDEHDILALSLQSKAVKYLAFLGDSAYGPLADETDKGILYFDHKFRVEAHHVEKIIESTENAAIVIRSTPRLKTSIWDEVEAAMKQERYVRHMTATKQYIESKLKLGISADTRICNTGLIYYSDPKAARPLVQSVLSCCLLQRQPECQIFWALHAQRYADMIKIIEWTDPAVVDITWKDPAPAPVQSRRLRSIFGLVRSKLKPLI